MQEWTNAMNSPEVPVNENFNALSWAAVYAKNALDTSGLDWAYYGGQWSGFEIDPDTLTLTDAATNYIVVNRSTGAISVSTSGTNWANTASYARVYQVTTASGLVTAEADFRSGTYGVHGATGGTGPVQSIIIACGDETTAPTSGAGKVTFRMPYAMTLTALPRASLTTAQSSGTALTIDINAGGTSILSTKLTVDNSEKTSTTAATPAVVSDATLADDQEITIDFDAVGTGGAGVKVTLIGTRD